MAVKGVLPSDLWDRYDREDGFDRMTLDLEIANEINDRISEAHEKAKSSRGANANDANAIVGRRNRRRAARKQHLSNTDDFFSAVEKAGVPVRKEGGVDE